MKKIISLAVLPFLLAACASDNTGGTYGTPSGSLGEESLTDATVPSQTDDSYLLAPAPKFYIGTPYKVEDTLYTPAEDMYYNQTGIAGIIPVDLNGSQTTNGETFDVNQMVATSKTLPLPTIVRVTNLNNGNSAVLRVNNRGPFINSRIMDVSPAAARKLGMTGQTKVQIQVLADQSAQVKAATLGTAVTAAPVVTSPQPTYTPPVATTGGTGPYSVQVAAFYSEDNANSMVQRMSKYGDARVVQESGMYKVRLINMDAAGARSTIDALRRNESMAPGLLKDGRWINPDSI
ncbi:MAG: septal ring lytic transglycosylase RlpA family protein [Proteobacteria bacterium]|nr:septal ring lytic transglycosylase RlpA family protein [Pseudomonadota bacterium]